MKILVALTILSHIISISAKKCCPSDDIIRENATCTDNSELRINSTCKWRAILSSHEFAIASNGSLIVLGGMDEFIPENMFCLGKYGIHNENVSVACMPIVEEETISFTGRAVCAVLSVLFLMLTIIVYLLVPKLRDLQGKCILGFMIGLALAFLCLAVVQLHQFGMSEACLFWAFALYFTFLIAFFWLNVVAINMWRKTVIPNWFHKSDNFWFALYSIYGLGGPGIFLLSTIITHHMEGNHLKPGFGDGICFLNGPLPLWIYFYGPIATLLIINLILFVWSSVKLWLDTSQHLPRVKNLKYKCLLTLKLCLIMGVPWSFEVISFTFENTHQYLNYLWTATDYLNALQGVLIFLVLVLFRKKALRGLATNPIIGSKFPRSWERLDDGEYTSDIQTLSESK